MILEEAIGKVKLMDDGKVRLEIKKHLEAHIEDEHAIRTFTESLATDKSACKELSIDYATMPAKDYDRLYLVAWYVHDVVYPRRKP